MGIEDGRRQKKGRLTEDMERVEVTAGRSEVKVAGTETGDDRGSEHRRKKHGRKEGRGSELGMASKEIHWAVNGTDNEALARREWCSEEAKAEKEADRRCGKIMAGELEEIMAKTPIERIWKAFEEVEEKEIREEEAERWEREKERVIRVELAKAERRKRNR